MRGAGGVGGLVITETLTASGVILKTSYPAYDGNGNVTAVVENIGNTATVVATYRYDAYGQLIATTGDPSKSAYRFSTKPYDELTGLYYYGYRYYDPVTGRWPSRDPIGESGGLNLYGMVGNDAVDSVDYLGLAERNSWLVESDKRAAWLKKNQKDGNILEGIGNFFGATFYGIGGSFGQVGKEMNPADPDAKMSPQAVLKEMTQPDDNQRFPNDTGLPDSECEWCISGKWRGTVTGGFGAAFFIGGGSFKGEVKCVEQEHVKADVTVVTGALGIVASGGAGYVGQLSIELVGAKTAADLPGKRFGTFASAWSFNKGKGGGIGGNFAGGESSPGFGGNYNMFLLWVPGTVQ